MALWSAAVFVEQSRDYQAIRTEMYADAIFQQLRLENGLAGLHGSLGSSPQRIMLARVLLGLDHISASVITARIFEETLDGIADVYKITIPSNVKPYHRKQTLIDIIMERQEILHDFELKPGWRKYWSNYRKRAIHSVDREHRKDQDDKPLTKKEVTAFMNFVEALSKRLSELRQVR